MSNFRYFLSMGGGGGGGGIPVSSNIIIGRNHEKLAKIFAETF